MIFSRTVLVWQETSLVENVYVGGEGHTTIHFWFPNVFMENRLIFEFREMLSGYIRKRGSAADLCQQSWKISKVPEVFQKLVKIDLGSINRIDVIYSVIDNSFLAATIRLSSKQLNTLTKSDDFYIYDKSLLMEFREIFSQVELSQVYIDNHS